MTFRCIHLFVTGCAPCRLVPLTAPWNTFLHHFRATHDPFRRRAPGGHAGRGPEHRDGPPSRFPEARSLRAAMWTARADYAPMACSIIHRSPRRMRFTRPRPISDRPEDCLSVGLVMVDGCLRRVSGFDDQTLGRNHHRLCPRQAGAHYEIRL